MDVRLVAALFALAIATYPRASPAESHRWDLTYSVSIAGIPLLQATSAIEWIGERYRLEARAMAAWPFDAVFPWYARAVSQGTMAGSTIQPDSYEALSHWAGSDRGVALRYREGALDTVTYTPPTSSADRDLVSIAMRRGTTDPIAGMLSLLGAVARGAPCRGRVPIYDGRRRYDLQLSSVDQPNSASEGNSAAAEDGLPGPCRLHFHTIAGARAIEQSRFWQTTTAGTGRPPMLLWLTRLSADGPVVPMRAATDSVLGTVRIALRHVQGPVGDKSAAGPAE